MQLVDLLSDLQDVIGVAPATPSDESSAELNPFRNVVFERPAAVLSLPTFFDAVGFA
jgi:hypothetical protein